MPDSPDVLRFDLVYTLGKSDVSSAFEAEIARLRALDCRCPLRFDQATQTAIPLTPGDARDCPYHSTHEDS